jgi:dynein heavy chain
MNFLGTKKNAFPRFFFLSVDDLLDILSNGDKPQKINKAGHITKIFQAIEYFKMKDNGDQMPDITGIVSCTGKETFDFRQALPLRGKVEIYMQDVIDHIVDQ